MAIYKNIPVEPEVYEKLSKVAAAYRRKLGAQVRLLVEAEYEKLRECKLLEPAGPLDEERDARVAEAVRAMAQRIEAETEELECAEVREMAARDEAESEKQEWAEAQQSGDEDDEA